MSKDKLVTPDLIQEGERVMRICNACRYCEGFCAVFPAMERRLTFEEKDLNYLANLCHNCTECYYACQYDPPHEFELNFPKTLAEIRMETYQKYAWPGALAGLYRNNGAVASILTAVSIIAILLIVMFVSSPEVLYTAYSDQQGSFYRVMSHHAMVYTFASVALLMFAAFVIGFVRFMNDTGGKLGEMLSPTYIAQAISDTLKLRYLDGSGEGCAYPDELPSNARRNFHHLTFYGFMLCFAATVVGTFNHYVMGWQSPPPLISLLGGSSSEPINFLRSLPPILGSLGGLGLLLGPLGLLWIKGRRNSELADKRQNGMDAGFLVLLFLTSLTGFFLMYFRQTALVGTFLVLHLGVVMGLFLTMPYGKFVHGIYRFGALLRNAYEDRNMQKLGSE